MLNSHSQAHAELRDEVKKLPSSSLYSLSVSTALTSPSNLNRKPPPAVSRRTPSPRPPRLRFCVLGESRWCPLALNVLSFEFGALERRIAQLRRALAMAPPCSLPALAARRSPLSGSNLDHESTIQRVKSFNTPSAWQFCKRDLGLSKYKTRRP